MGEWFDGNWVDMGSLLVALAYAYWKTRCAKKRFISKYTAIQLANGTSLFPLTLLGLSLFSSKLLSALLSANKLILSVAGICALLAMLEEDV